MAVDIDPLWSTVRLPSGSDGFWMAILLAFAVVMAAAAPLVSTQSPSYVPYATAAVAFGAGFLSARAGRSICAPAADVPGIAASATLSGVGRET